MDILVKVDIRTGRVLVNNLEEFWSRLAAGEGRPEPPRHQNPALTRCGAPTGAGSGGSSLSSHDNLAGVQSGSMALSPRGSTAGAQQSGKPLQAQNYNPGSKPCIQEGEQDDVLLKKIRRFSRRRKKQERTNCWSERELYLLAVLTDREKRTFQETSVKLNRSVNACRCMYRFLKLAGITRGRRSKHGKLEASL